MNTSLSCALLPVIWLNLPLVKATTHIYSHDLQFWILLQVFLGGYSLGKWGGGLKQSPQNKNILDSACKCCCSQLNLNCVAYVGTYQVQTVGNLQRFCLQCITIAGCFLRPWNRAESGQRFPWGELPSPCCTMGPIECLTLEHRSPSLSFVQYSFVIVWVW